MVCFWRKFVAIMERMQPSVARLEALLKLYEQDVLEAVVSRRTAWASAAVQQRGHSLKTFDLARQQPPPVGYPPSARQQPPPVGYPPSACQQPEPLRPSASATSASQLPTLRQHCPVRPRTGEVRLDGELLQRPGSHLCLHERFLALALESSSLTQPVSVGHVSRCKHKCLLSVEMDENVHVALRFAYIGHHAPWQKSRFGPCECCRPYCIGAERYGTKFFPARTRSSTAQHPVPKSGFSRENMGKPAQNFRSKLSLKIFAQNFRSKISLKTFAQNVFGTQTLNNFSPHTHMCVPAHTYVCYPHTHMCVFPAHTCVFPAHNCVIPAHNRVFPTHTCVFPAHTCVFPAHTCVSPGTHRCVPRTHMCVSRTHMCVLRTHMCVPPPTHT